MNALKYFEEICKIPRESGNEKGISEYLVKFAQDNNLEYYTDEYYNVIIKKKSTNGSNDTIILQDHTDMVCTSDIDYDFKNNGIDYYIEDGYYKAHHTTLGADNGIGCSILLSILSNNNLKHPNLECVFTTQEETTMLGAKTLDYSKITGKKLISVDGTDEGVIEVACAGMASIKVCKQIEYEENNDNTYKISITGLPGGHSGVEIDKNRGNSLKLMTSILKDIKNYHLISITGGSKENVIPSECECLINTDEIIDVDKYYDDNYPDLKIEIIEQDECAKVIKKEISDPIIEFMHTIQSGVLTYRGTFPQTSLNLATIKTINNSIEIEISIRSSKTEEEKQYVDYVRSLAGTDLDFELLDTKPFFSFKEFSPLRDLLVKKYKELYGKDCILEDVHAGLEGGIFAQNIKDLEICVIAPNLYDIHSINERVEIESVNRVYEWLVKTLEEL
jgi:dipeptidase D